MTAHSYIKLRHHIILLLVFVGLSLPVHGVAASEKIILGSNDPIESTNGKYYNLLYREAFSRLGLDFEYRFLPAKRASAEADAGRIDGEVARILAYGEKHPNLVRVEEAAMSDAFSAFSTNPSIKLNGWQSLQNTSYKVEYLHGVFRVEQQLTEIVPPANLSTISSLELGLRKLAIGRTDIYIDSEAAVKGLLATHSFKKTNIHSVGLMEKTEYYAYLHVRRQEIVPKLAKVLNQMKAEGLMQQFRQQALFESYKTP